MTPKIPDEDEIEVVFDYSIQQIPLPAQRSSAFSHKSIHVFVKLTQNGLRPDGTPTPRVLWFAEQKFRQRYYQTHGLNVRLIGWKSHLANSSETLSEYRIVLPASSN